jgi:hypothetical protein
VAHWAAVVLLLAFAALGLDGGISAVDAADTIGQRVATAAQVGYALVGFAAAGALVSGRSWAPRVLWLWGGLLTLTGMLAPVVWGGAGLAVGIAAGAATAAIAAVVMWLAGRPRAA